jgi:Concanavalin A-like lectin/glucanases superfamily
VTNRKRLAVAMAAACTLALPASAEAAGYQDGVLASNPLTYLRLDEPAGASVAEDASPNDRDGAYAGGVTLGGAAPFADAGTAPALAASGTVGADVAEPSRTLELWVNPNRLAKGQQAGIVAHGNPASDGWAVGIGTRRKLAVVTGGTEVQTKITLPSAVWTLVTVTWSDKPRVYLNGALKKQLTGGPATGAGAFVLGGSAAGAFPGNFTGRLDEAALYPDALSAATIQSHFAAAHVPANTAPPEITGTATVGQTLTVQPGAWSDAATATRTYQWQRCDENGEDCGDIAGATGTTHVLGAEDECMTLQVAETVTNPSGAGTAISDAAPRVGPCPDPPPVNTAIPAIGGAAEVAATLTAVAGTWSHAAGGTWTYQWRRCDETGATCVDIAGATGTTYVVDAEDDCMRLQVAETVTTAAGTDSAVSDPTGEVAPCADPDPDPTPDPHPTPDPDPDPTPDPAPDPGTGSGTGTGTVATTTGGSMQPAAQQTTATCLRLVAGRKRTRLRGYGVLRLAAKKNACITGPIKARVKSRKALKSVRYKLDGKRLKRVRKLKHGAKLRPARLSAGTHKLSFRVTPRKGKAKTFKVRLRVAVA